MKKLPKAEGANKGGEKSQQNGKRRISTGLRTKDQILKERNRKAKVQKFQNRKKGGSSKGGGSKGWNSKNKSSNRRSFKSKR